MLGRVFCRVSRLSLLPVLLTRQNLKPSIEEAIKYLATGQSRARCGVGGLQLLDGEEIAPEKSPYANYFLDFLREKGGNQVVNRGAHRRA